MVAVVKIEWWSIVQVVLCYKGMFHVSGITSKWALFRNSKLIRSWQTFDVSNSLLALNKMYTTLKITQSSENFVKDYSLNSWMVKRRRLNVFFSYRIFQCNSTWTIINHLVWSLSEVRSSGTSLEEEKRRVENFLITKLNWGK